MSLHRFLSSRNPVATGSANWARLGISFSLASYLDLEIPPTGYITSVRAVVRVSDRVVVLENDDGRHFLPGGRIESGESYLEALAREIEEESGLTMVGATLLGFIHFHHLTPKPEPFPYPYPDMIHLVYGAIATGTIRSGDSDGWGEGCVFDKSAGGGFY